MSIFKRWGFPFLFVLLTQAVGGCRGEGWGHSEGLRLGESGVGLLSEVGSCGGFTQLREQAKGQHRLSHSIKKSQQKTQHRGKIEEEEKKKKKAEVLTARWLCTNLPTCLPTLRSRTSFKLMKMSERNTKVGAYGTCIRVMTARAWSHVKDGKDVLAFVVVLGRSNSSVYFWCFRLHTGCKHATANTPFSRQSVCERVFVCVWNKAAVTHAASLCC